MLESKKNFPTLRQYIDDYQYLRKIKSNKGLISQQKSQASLKPTIDLQHSVKEHVNIIKKMLTSLIEDNTRLSIALHFEELTKLINQLLQKLRSLQSAQGGQKNMGSVSSQNHLSSSNVNKNPLFGRKASIQESLKHSNPELKIQKNQKLMSPQYLSRRISNLGSIATQDFTPISPRINYQKNKKTSSTRLKLGEGNNNKQINTIANIEPAFSQNPISSQIEQQIQSTISKQSLYKIRIKQVKDK